MKNNVARLRLSNTNNAAGVISAHGYMKRPMGTGPFRNRPTIAQGRKRMVFSINTAGLLGHPYGKSHES